jgi:hypothetical protein
VKVGPLLIFSISLAGRFTFNAGEMSVSGRFVETANYMNCLEHQRIMPSVTLAKVEPHDW